jgi:phenylpropionate dioxygenase-like ring-hydroxylating dioxygenase large terminal subunit
MLTREENEMLTRVGPGTPAGELLRRYWFPVGVASELTAENPTQIVRILGETLVLFRDKAGRVGLLNDRCSHRGASLCYGRVEERGIACPYHGWLYDTKGNCLETPAEPADSKFHLTVKQKSYPVQKLAGLCWAYLGSAPAPIIPNFDIWFRNDGGFSSSRSSTVTGFKRWRIPWTRRTYRFSTRIPPIAAVPSKTRRED